MSGPNMPLWITYDQAIAIHARQLRRFGGAPGLRDDGKLQSALERPIKKWRDKGAALAELAAAYAFCWPRIMPLWMETSASPSWRWLRF
jgi:death on curing protein